MGETENIVGDRYKLFDIIWETHATYIRHGKDMLLERPVAVRQYWRYSSKEVRYFKTEVDMLSKLVHTNIVPLLDVIDDNQSPAIVYPPLHPVDMKHFLDLDIISILKFFERVADALDFIHSKGIIHRVVSPFCIMTDENMNPYLINFALAVDYIWLAEQGEIESVAGFPAYLSPEAIRRKTVKPASDIYSFGMVLFEALAGKVAYEGRGRRDFYEAHLEDPIPSIASARPDLSLFTIQAIDNLFIKLLSKEPDERHHTAMFAINDLYDLVYRGEYNPKSPIEGKLFISYARHDEAYVLQLAEELKRHNIEFWYDKNLEVGSTWDDAINHQLKVCDAILIISTQQSMASLFVTYEWSYFIGAGKPVLPFIPDDAGKPEDFLHPVLARIQGVRSTNDVSEDVQKIIKILRKLLAKDEPPPSERITLAADK